MLKYKILLILFIISLVASAMLAIAPNGETCDLDDDCSAVQLSKQSETFGIKNYYFGIGIFLILIVLTFSEIRRPKKMKRFIIDMAVILGTIVALYFLYLMIFVLNSYCQYCLAVDISMILGFLTLLFYHKKRRKWLYHK